MRSSRIAWVAGAVAFLPLIAQPSSTPLDPPDSCRVTQPPREPLVPPAPYPQKAPRGTFWHGTSDLWTALRADGTWRLRAGEKGYGQKVFWWRPGYDGAREQRPALTLTGKRLDEHAEDFSTERATNAWHQDFGGWTMLAGVEVPTPGCWEITGHYRDHEVNFVVWLAP